MSDPVIGAAAHVLSKHLSYHSGCACACGKWKWDNDAEADTFHTDHVAQVLFDAGLLA